MERAYIFIVLQVDQLKCSNAIFIMHNIRLKLNEDKCCLS